MWYITVRTERKFLEQTYRTNESTACFDALSKSFDLGPDEYIMVWDSEKKHHWGRVSLENINDSWTTLVRRIERE